MNAQRLVLLTLASVGCQKEPATTDTTTTDTGTGPENLYPLPDDIAEIDFVSAFTDAVKRMTTVSTQQPWVGHTASLATGELGCPDYWTGQFTVSGVMVGDEDGLSWNDDCVTTAGRFYDGWSWWDSTVRQSGDPTTYEGRTSEGSRRLSGDAVVGDANGITFEFDGDVADSLYRVEAYGYERVVYSSTMDATVTGSDVFAGNDDIPRGYRTDLVMSLSGGDVDNFDARGNVYLFEEVLSDRFDSIAVDMELQGPLGAGPDACTLEPLGWIGLRDAEAYWYDLVFLPRFEEDLVDVEYPNDPLSICDGCGRLYVQGIEQEGLEVCVDFSFLFDGSMPLPEIDDYALPWRPFDE